MPAYFKSILGIYRGLRAIQNRQSSYTDRLVQQSTQALIELEVRRTAQKDISPSFLGRAVSSLFLTALWGPLPKL